MKGQTYFDWRKGFSINEGQYPSIHMGWGDAAIFGFDFYMCLWNDVRLWFHIGRERLSIGVGSMFPRETAREFTWSRKQ